METIKIPIGRLSVTLIALSDQQISNVFGLTGLSVLTAPPVPEGTTQEEAYVGSEEFRAAYDQFARDVNRLETIGFLAASRDPILVEFSLAEDDPIAIAIEAERAEIQRAANKLGFVADSRYPEGVTEGEMIAFIAEKSAKFFPEGFVAINNYVSLCLKKVGFVGGSAIDAEIKSETPDLSGQGPDGAGDESSQQTKDPVREIQPVA